VRNHDLGAIGSPKQAGWGIVDADDVVRQTGDLDASIHRVALAEEILGQLGIDHRDVCVGRVLEIGE